MEQQHYPAGAILGKRYEVLAMVAKGAMGTVYLASDAQSRQSLVALKVLDPQLMHAADALARFRGEVVASYRVEHPNVVKAFQYFDEPDFQAYAMEYVDGGSLKNVLRDGPVDPQWALSILRQVAAGLAAIHAAGIVHRDLKPENILLSKRGEVKITDFGVARVHHLQNVTKIGELVGTAHYVAPEYVETGECDHRGDIYALGVIAYEMLAGKAPFPVEASVASLAERFRRPAVPLQNVAPHCPGRLAHIVERAMSLKVSDRYQDAASLARDLGEALPGSYSHDMESDFEHLKPNSGACPDPLVETVRIPNQSHLLFNHKRRLGLGWPVILALGIALGVMLLWLSMPPRQVELSEEQEQSIRLEILAP